MNTSTSSSYYKIKISPIQGGGVLTFTVDHYETIDADFIEFVDRKTRRKLRFHASNCEIEVIEGDIP